MHVSLVAFVSSAALLAANGCSSSKDVTIVEASCVEQGGVLIATANLASFDPALGDTVTVSFCDPQVNCTPGSTCSGCSVAGSGDGGVPECSIGSGGSNPGLSVSKGQASVGCTNLN